MTSRLRGTFGPYPACPGVWLTGGMFVHGQLEAAVRFGVALTRLAALARGDELLRAARVAHGQGITGLARDDPPGPAPGTPGLVSVRAGDLVADDDRAHMPLRWEAIAPAGELFPVLDANLALIPAGERSTTLDLAGVYRLPPGTWGNGLDPSGLQRFVSATIQGFLGRVAAAIGSDPSAEGNGGPADQGGSLPPAAGAP